MAYTCNSSTQEAEAGGLLRVQGQFRLQSETLSQKGKNKKKKSKLK